MSAFECLLCDSPLTDGVLCEWCSRPCQHDDEYDQDITFFDTLGAWAIALALLCAMGYGFYLFWGWIAAHLIQ